MRLTREQSRAVTRRKLIDSAIIEFADVGYCEGRIESIAERAEFTRGAFYANFTDKGDLMMAVIEECESVSQLRTLDALAVAEFWRTARCRRELSQRLNAYPLLGALRDLIVRAIK